MVIYTIGHSTHPAQEFVAILKAHHVEALVDIRTVPRSRHNPQFEGPTLAETLMAAGIEYQHMKDLGGLRKPRPDTRNSAWRNDSFRGYADYMQTAPFAKALEELRELAQSKTAAIMCAESVPWRCHRNLVADAVVMLYSDTVRHIMSKTTANQHKPSAMARVDNGQIVYDAGQKDLLT